MTNTTSNSTLPSTDCSWNPTAERIAKILAYILLLAVSLIGNILIGAIVFKTTSMRKTINYLIVNMAMSDLILTIFAFPRILADLFVGYWLIDGPLGLALCKLVYFIQDASNAVSIQSLVLIAMDRFGAVVFPLRPPVVSSKLCPYFILATWVVAMAIHCPILFARKLFVMEGKVFCTSAFGQSSWMKSYYVAMFIVLAVIPFALMTVLYSVIILSLRSQKMPVGESVNAEEQEKRVERERNVLRMVIAIVVGFALCWAPFNIMAFLTFFVWEKNPALTCGFKAFHFIALFIAYGNCALNPCICFIFCGNYRQGIKSVFGCCSHECNCACFGAVRSQS